MKKSYINPETDIVLLTLQTMIADSIEGFNQELDDKNEIEPEDMLSRRHNNVWDEEGDLEEEAKDNI